MKPLISTLMIVLGTTFAANSVMAQQVCMSADEMGAALIDWYGETPINAPTESREQTWVSQATGTWTVVKTFADGQSCVVAQGDDWIQGMDQEQIVAALRQ